MQSTGVPNPVLHIDVDVYFCQVEQNLNPSLKGRAFAIQQHQDIIAVNYVARAAGVKKHMGTKEARILLNKVRGIVHHVHMEAGGRVSYKPYRDVSKIFINRLRQFAGVGVIEKASIDEAYVLYKLEPQQQSYGTMTVMQQAAQLAETMRQAVLQELSLVVSVGIASNKMVAKLASQASKPDGILVIDGEPALQRLLQATPAARLPRCGGKVTDTLTVAGVHTVADLQAWSAQQLQKDLGFAPDQAKQLSEWSHGLDSSPVAERPPPKTLSIQMTLTPIPLAMHPSMGRDIAVAGGKAGLLQPLPIGALNLRERLDGLLAAMGADILGRVMGDKLEEDRWPQKFELQMRAFRNSDRKSKTAVRSCGFPSPSLLTAADTGTPFSAETGAGLLSVLLFDQNEMKTRCFARSKLEAALVANAVKLSKNAAAGLPDSWNLVQVEMAASNFASFSAAAAPSMHKFLQTAAAKARQHHAVNYGHVNQVSATPAACAEQLDLNDSDSAEQAYVPSIEAWVQASAGHQEAVEQAVGGQASASGGECLQESEMYGVNVEQQRQMLREIEVRHSSVRQQRTSQSGVKRTHSGQQMKPSVKQTKPEVSAGRGQQTITSLFAQGQ